MAKDNKPQVSEDAPKLVLETGENTTDAVVNETPEVQTGEVVETATATTEAQVGEQVGEVNDINVVENQTDDVKNDFVKIRVLLPLAGKFLLPYDPGHEIEINANQANAIVDAGYGEFIVEKSEEI